MSICKIDEYSDADGQIRSLYYDDEKKEIFVLNQLGEEIGKWKIDVDEEKD